MRIINEAVSRDPRIIEFFIFITALPEMAMFASNVFTAAQKVTCNGVRPGDQWIRSLLLVHLG